MSLANKTNSTGNSNTMVEFEPRNTRTAQLANFPPELVLHIFEDAAQSSSASCKALCLVSSWCRRMALPYLFDTAVFMNLESLEQFRSILFNEQNDDAQLPPRLQISGFRPSRSVRSLWIPFWRVGMLKIFQQCDALENLAMGFTTFRWLVGVLILESERGWNQSPSKNPLDEITHIRLTNPMPYNDQTLNIAAFPRLTHFAIPFASYSEHDLNTLASLLGRRSLEMIVIVLVSESVTMDDRMAALKWLRDIRKVKPTVFLVEASGDSENLRNEWECEARGGQSIWERAIGYTRAVIPSSK